MLAQLGLAATEVDRLRDIPPKQLVAAQIALAPSFVARPIQSPVEVEPVVDGGISPSTRSIRRYRPRPAISRS